MNDQYRMKLKPAAEAFGVGYMKLWTAVSDGKLAGLKVGTHWTVRPEDVEAWMHEVGTANSAEKARSAS